MSLFRTLREDVPLPTVARRFTDLAQSGRSLVGRCPYPDHVDTSPSFHVYPDDRFYCFGCRRHGDVTELWGGVNGLKPGVETAFDLAREYGVAFTDVNPDDSDALRDAEKRRNLEALYEAQAREAHERLTEHPGVVEWWQGRGFDVELREIFLLGANEDGSEATIPFLNRSRVHGLIRRKLKGDPKYLLPRAEEFPYGYRPLFLPGTARKEVLLVEGYLDALSATALGFEAIAIGGTGISQHQKDELWDLPCPVYYVLPDDDEEGAKAARRWVRDLYPRILLCPPIRTMHQEEDAGD